MKPSIELIEFVRPMFDLAREGDLGPLEYVSARLSADVTVAGPLSSALEES